MKGSGVSSQYMESPAQGETQEQDSPPSLPPPSQSPSLPSLLFPLHDLFSHLLPTSLQLSHLLLMTTVLTIFIVTHSQKSSCGFSDRVDTWWLPCFLVSSQECRKHRRFRSGQGNNVANALCKLWKHLVFSGQILHFPNQTSF